MNIIGRKSELALFRGVLKSNKPEFIAVYGRRRVGKTFLISQFFKDKGIYFEITGSKDAPNKEQLGNFHREFTALFGSIYAASPKTWSDALYRLAETIQNIKTENKIIIFIDELPWLATPRSGFMSALEYTWNRHLSRISNVKLIICGSAAAWMIKHVINNKGGLYGRLSRSIPLAPFTLAETEQYFISENINLDRRQIVNIYMVTGGIGKYLSLVPRGMSATQIINYLCFSPSAPLMLEFSKLFQSLFENSAKHINIIKSLAAKKHGMSQEELLKSAKLTPSGQSSTILSELEECGFIMIMSAFGKKSKQKIYRLIDEYSLFYLNWIEPRRSSILAGDDPDMWLKTQSTPRGLTWAGYAFEDICLKHVAKIKHALGIAAVSTSVSSFCYRPKSKNEKGAQIDLLIDRNDGCINLCEIKFSHTEFTIDKKYASELKQKLEVFTEQTKTKKTIFITLITPYGVKPNQYYNELVHSEVTIDDLFA